MSKKERRRGNDSFGSPEASGFWRLFIAAPISQDVRGRMHELVAMLSGADLPIRWVDPAISHITLHFLGETEPERAELLRMSLASVNLRTGPIQLETSRIGAFPDERRPRVVWLGLRGQTDKLGYAHLQFARMLQGLGFETETRAFNPHITLGRARDNPPGDFPARLNAVIASKVITKFMANPVRFTVDEIGLYRSHLEKTGPRYERVSVVPLA
jgi:2'-5' RNA ligase